VQDTARLLHTRKWQRCEGARGTKIEEQRAQRGNDEEKAAMTPIRASLGALAILLAPVPAIGQQRGVDAAYVERRLAALQQQLANLSARLEQIRAQDQQFQQQLDGMRAKLEVRLERLEKAGSRAGRR
jgi:DNA repair exonuclease SbcCD ATPase subunit